MVTHLLDLVSSHFDHVVIDMPRTWFASTDNVLLGSNRTFIVSEMTVPAIKHARKLVAAINERLGEGPNPRVIVNRFEQAMFSTGLKKSDIDQALGSALAGVVPNDYRTVREAIDRGVPLNDVKANNKITQALRPLVLPPKAVEERPSRRGLSRLKLAWSK
jgi:pilus assembly protein CpaE